MHAPLSQVSGQVAGSGPCAWSYSDSPTSKAAVSAVSIHF